jgi:hypothetical protein
MAAWAFQSDNYLKTWNPWAVDKTISKQKKKEEVLNKPTPVADGETPKVICSVHRKMRSVNVLVDDGRGGYCCHEGSLCLEAINPWGNQNQKYDIDECTTIFETDDAWAPPSFQQWNEAKWANEPPAARHVCSIHGKTRVEPRLEPDGMGGWRCLPGKYACKKAGDGMTKRVFEDGIWRNGGLRTFNADLKVWVGGFPPREPDNDLNKSLKEHMHGAGRCIFAEIFSTGTGGAAYGTPEEANNALLTMHGSKFEYEGDTYTLQMGLWPVKERKPRKDMVKATP